MIFNYALTHHCCENSIFDEDTFYNLKFLFNEVKKSNIILIVDKSGYLINKIKKEIKKFSSDNKSDTLFNLLQEIQDLNKIYSHDLEYDKNDIQTYLDSIEKNGIILDGVIVDIEEENSFKNSIPIQKFSDDHIVDKKRRDIYDNGINLIKLKKLELENYGKRIIWDSESFSYFDYNLGNLGIKDINKLRCNSKDGEKQWILNGETFNPSKHDQLLKWIEGFKFLKNIIIEQKNLMKISNKVNIKIYTPQPIRIFKPNSFKQSDRDVLDNKIKSLEKNKLILEFIEDIIFKKLNDSIINFNIFFYDSTFNEDRDLGYDEHNRFFHSTSSNLIDVGKGLDIYHFKSKKIQQGRWRFIKYNKLTNTQEIINKNPRNAEKYNEYIEFLKNSLI